MLWQTTPSWVTDNAAAAGIVTSGCEAYIICTTPSISTSKVSKSKSRATGAGVRATAATGIDAGVYVSACGEDHDIYKFWKSTFAEATDNAAAAVAVVCCDGVAPSAPATPDDCIVAAGWDATSSALSPSISGSRQDISKLRAIGSG